MGKRIRVYHDDVDSMLAALQLAQEKLYGDCREELHPRYES